MLREIVRERNNAYKLAIRVDGNNGGYTAPIIYEVHSQISSFQLRVYILWARELICIEKVVTRTFVRVFFLHRCQETAVIKHTTNPIFNETLIFDEQL
uniref:C2 domain-containing protein n=1 Tax=Panagrolaimus superbus TaxID=310955 RepID=A0A914YTM0_9BILA